MLHIFYVLLQSKPFLTSCLITTGIGVFYVLLQSKPFLTEVRMTAHMICMETDTILLFVSSKSPYGFRHIRINHNTSFI